MVTRCIIICWPEVTDMPHTHPSSVQIQQEPGQIKGATWAEGGDRGCSAMVMVGAGCLAEKKNLDGAFSMLSPSRVRAESRPWLRNSACCLLRTHPGKHFPFLGTEAEARASWPCEAAPFGVPSVPMPAFPCHRSGLSYQSALSSTPPACHLSGAGSQQFPSRLL